MASPLVSIWVSASTSALVRTTLIDDHAGTWHRPTKPYDANKVHDDIKYTEEDDKAIDDWIADHVETTWHSLGTWHALNVARRC